MEKNEALVSLVGPKESAETLNMRAVAYNVRIVNQENLNINCVLALYGDSLTFETKIKLALETKQAV
jgi:hypothetical protein